MLGKDGRVSVFGKGDFRDQVFFQVLMTIRIGIDKDQKNN